MCTVAIVTYEVRRVLFNVRCMMYEVRCKVYILRCMSRDVGCLMYGVYGVRSVMHDVERNT